MSEDKQYDFYVAGPFFDPEQTASMERLEKNDVKYRFVIDMKTKGM